MQAQDVYIIDDAADYRLLLQQVFKRFLPQHNVRFFTGGNALHEHLLAESAPADPNQPNQSRPNLILLDLNMPGLSGYQTLTWLKQSPWKSVPVVIMTSEGSNEEIEQCYQAGANSFLIKPAGIDSMKQLMGDICQYWLVLNRLPVVESAVRLDSLR